MTEKLYERKQPIAIDVEENIKFDFFASLNAYLTKGLLFTSSWFVFVGIWINWSVNNGNYLLKETIPAFIIITFLLMLRTIDRQSE